MKLKVAIYLIETSYGFLLLISLFGIGACFFSLKGQILLIAIILLFSILISAVYLKLNLINLYLKRSKYPYEFLKVLEKLHLTEDLEVKWDAELIGGPKQSQMNTEQFIYDNNLATEFGVRKIDLPFALIMMGASFIGMLYFTKVDTLQGRILTVATLLLFFFGSLFLWVKGKRQSNSKDPVLLFKESGLFYNGVIYRWDSIEDWGHKSNGSDSQGKIFITYLNSDKVDVKVDFDLDKIMIDRVDFMLLLTHFNAKYR